MSSIDDMKKDFLEDLPPAEVAAFYDRLAQFSEKEAKNAKITDPLAPKFLRYWRNGRGKKLIFPAPDHLRQSKYVIDVLEDHRDWYLTKEKFNGKWVGVIPRLQGRGFPKWQPFRERSSIYPTLYIHLNSLVELPVKIFSSLLLC
jgi:hypothetical protein